MSNDEGGTAIPKPSAGGLSRREAIKKGAIVGGTVLWVTPLVQSVGMSPASAQTPSPGGGGCSCAGTESFDVKATLSGLVNATVGPIQNFPEDDGCLANLAVSATGNVADAFLTADLVCVGGTTAGGTCSSFVELTNLAVDLRAINSLLDLQLDASVVRAEATCTCGGGCTATSCITQADGEAILTFDRTVIHAGTGVAICEPLFLNASIDATALTPEVTVSVVLNDTSENPCQATVATIEAVVEGVQTVSIVIARATAVCTPTG